MAYTRAQLRGKIRSRMGWSATDTFISDADMNDDIIDSARELHTLLVNLWPAGQFGLQTFFIFTIVGQTQYTLPANFSRMVSVRMQIANTYVPIEPLDPTVDLLILDTRSWDYARTKYWLARVSDVSFILSFYPPPAAIYTLQLWFVQSPPLFATDGDTSWMGDDEYLILDCCIKACGRQEQDPAQFIQQKERYQQRLEQQATPIDLGRAPTLQDVQSAASREDIWWFRR